MVEYLISCLKRIFQNKFILKFGSMYNNLKKRWW
jgi:hypothetical protein